MNFIKITTTFLQHFQDISAFSLPHIVLFFHIESYYAFISNHMLLFFISFNLHKISPLILTARINCTNNFTCIFTIIKSFESESSCQSQLECFHCLNLQIFSYKDLTLLEQYKDELSYNDKIFDSNLIVYTDFYKCSCFCNIYT